MKQRIRQYRLAAGLSASDVARALGVSRGAVYHWENLESPTMPDVTNCLAFSTLVGRSVADLLGQAVRPGTDEGARRGRVPVIELEAVRCADFLTDLSIEGVADRYIPCPFDHDPATFAAVMVNETMTSSSGSSYPPGTICYFDPARQCESRSIVLARLPDGSPVMRQLVDEDGERFLRPLNAEFSRIDQPFDLVARLIGHSAPD